MSARTGGPFEQRRLTRRERREAERRAEARAAARAAAMPPPDPTTRVDLTGLSRSEPAEPAAVPAPRPSLRQVAAARSEPASVTPPSPPQPVQPAPAPAAPAQPAPAWPIVPQLPEPAPARAGTVTAALRRPWTGRAATAALALGGAALVVAFAAALGWGAPVLGHPANPGVLAAGVAGVAGGVWLLSRGWASSRALTRRAAAASVALLVAAFSLGVLTNPVVVDGRVFLATSAEAREYQLMTQIHTDLLRLRQMDVYLTYSAADAGAHNNEYAPALAELTAMSDKYAGYTPDQLPDPRFAETIADTKSAAYWAQRAMQSKIALLDQDDAKYSDDVVNFRANFAQQYLAAGRALSFLSADLNIPLDTREHE